MQKIIKNLNFKNCTCEICKNQTDDIECIKHLEKENKTRINVYGRDKKLLYKSELSEKVKYPIVEITFLNKTERKLTRKQEFVNAERSLRYWKENFDYKICNEAEYQENKGEISYQLNPCKTIEDYNKQVKEVMKSFTICVDEVRPIAMDIAKRILIDNLCTYPIQPVEDHEVQFLNYVRNSFTYMESNNVFVKTGYQYDINSFYPYCLSQEDLYCPIKEGTAKNIKSLDELKNLFLYSVILEVDYSNFPYMKEQGEKVYYSNYDIELFNKAKVPYKIFETTDNNLLYYEKSDCVSCKTLFGNMYKKLYKMKSNGNKVAGQISRLLHGVMFQSNIERIPIDENLWKNIDRAIKVDNKYIYCTKDGNSSQFKSGFARLKMFLYSYTRLNFYSNYIHNQDYRIYRIWIDSIITDKPLDEDDHFIGSKLGWIKYEGKYKDIVFEKSNVSYKKFFVDNQEPENKFEETELDEIDEIFS